jgi:hypothetical protein
MATLSLKKPKYIGEISLPDLHEKFVVVHQSRGKRSFRFTAYHDNFDAALKEANRLKKAIPDQRFLVLQVQGFADWGA